MRIAIVTRCLIDGGTERVIARLSILWSSMGHQVIFLTARPKMDGEFDHSCITRIAAPYGQWTAEEFLCQYECTPFDVCVFNDGWNDKPFKPLVNACHKIGVKVVTILHHAFNNWAFCQCNEGDFGKDDILQKIDCLVCVDKMQALWWLVRGANVAYIQNPVHFEREISKPGNRQGSTEFVWVGRPKDSGKRVELAIDVFGVIQQKLLDAHLTVVGAISKDIVAALRKRVSAVCWSKIKFFGYVPDVGPILSQGAVNLVTTQWEVTVPQVVLEAMSFGVPSVCFDLPVFRQLTNGNGVARVSSCEAMAEAAVKLSQDDGYRKSVLEKVETNLDARNRETESKWRLLFDSIGTGAPQHSKNLWHELNADDTYYNVLREVQRGESFFVSNAYQELLRYRAIKLKVNRILGLFGLKRR